MRAKPTRREQDVLEVLYRSGEASAEAVRIELDISNSAVRTLLARLEEKGRVERLEDGRRFLYRPVPRATKAGREGARRLVDTFFRGRPGDAVLAVMRAARDRMSDEEWDALVDEVARAKREEGEG